MNPRPTALSSSDLADAIQADVRGPERELRRVLAPTRIEEAPSEVRAAAVVAVFDAKDASALVPLGLGALVIPSAAEETVADAIAELAETGAAEPARLLVEDPRLALARLTRVFDTRSRPSSSHPSAHVAEDADLGEGVVLEAGAVVGRGARIGAGTIVGAGSVISDGVRVGRDCRLFPNVTLVDNVVIGDRVVLHAGVVIGADGFGYARGPRGAEKIHHLGGVVIEDDVEIGANTAVDAGALEPTRVGARTKIDNLCQIAHNVQIGHDCLIAGFAGIAGSVEIGPGSVLAGGVIVRDHVTLGAGVTIAMRSAVTKDVPAGETWGGYPAQPRRAWARERYLIGRLETIWTRIREGS